jgi:tellurite methyltransferase
MNKSYWREFYKSKVDINFPSSFAKAVLKEHQDVQAIIDLGAGNGRDSIYFAHHVTNVVYVDQIDGLGDIELENVSSVIGGLESMRTWNEIKEASKSKGLKMFYARFLIHSLDESELNSFVTFVSEASSRNDRLVLEYRITDADVTLQYDNHERKYYEPDYIAQKVVAFNWTQNKQEIGKGFAKFRNEDPLICRQLFSKK